MLVRLRIVLSVYWFLSWYGKYWLVIKTKENAFVCSFHFSVMCFLVSTFVLGKRQQGATLEFNSNHRQNIFI